MARRVEDIENKALKFWPTELARRELELSVIPRLIETQEKFIGILYVADGSFDAWKNVLNATQDIPPNLFLKHLIVLTDVGGEPLQRIRGQIQEFFPDRTMHFIWKDNEHEYSFKSLDEIKAWNNTRLGVDGPGLTKPIELTKVIEDVVMILLHGGAAVDANVPNDVLEKCCVGTMMGNKTELNTYVRQRYIHVSRITSGATANTMGHLIQTYVREWLQDHLNDWNFSQTTIPGISQTSGRTDMSFDFVAESPKGKYCGIEVSFQVTTNSTIERKSGQAASRHTLLHQKGHRIAYVIDGAGNFQRRSALETICRYSDCTVALADEELSILMHFLENFDAE